jgi:hypothetical protein
MMLLNYAKLVVPFVEDASNGANGQNAPARTQSAEPRHSNVPMLTLGGNHVT